MIAIGKGTKLLKKTQASPSISQKAHARKAEAQYKKKMTVEKCERLKRAGLVK